MANAANHVALSSGQVLFADPNVPWSPYDLPRLPAPQLTITAQGQIATRNISTLAFSNVIAYENYENPSLRGGLTKSLVVNSGGQVTYDDPRLSLVSTSLSAYNVGVTGFTPPNLGGPGIQGGQTLTNAIAQLDGWLSNCLLVQPPSAALAETEETSLYAGVRWINFPVYNTLQVNVPYVSGIVLMLGDPTSGDYLTLELTNPNWFPDEQFTDGLASYFNPLVRLRIFNQFFLGSASLLYSKAYMQTQCVRIIGEGGIYTLPSSGKVFAVQNSENDTQYPTVNLYLPQIPTETVIPVRVFFINRTKASPTGFLAYTSTTTFGAPSAVSSVAQFVSTPTSFTLQVGPPVFADETHSVSSCYFSSYVVQYTASQLNTAHTGDLGFRYGQAAPTPLPAYLSSYVNSTFTYSAIFQPGIQNITVSGSGNYAVLPGIHWSTSIYATNSAQLIGSTLSGPEPTVSAFPMVVAPSISSATILGTNAWVANVGSSNLAYINYSNGWSIGTNLSTSAVFLASTQLMTYNINGVVRFNDPSYPGCRSNVIQTSVFTDIDLVPQIISLTQTPIGDDFVLDTTTGAAINNNFLSSLLTETEILPQNQKFYYETQLSGGQLVSNVSIDAQHLQFQQTTSLISGYNDPIEDKIVSTPLYAFVAESGTFYGNSGIRYDSSITSSVQVSGLYTPQIGSEFLLDIYGSNFIYNFTQNSNMGAAQLYFDTTAITPLTNYTSSIRIYDGTTELTSTPFPIDTDLHLSSVGVRLNALVYQDPSDPKTYEFKTLPTPANPAESRGLRTTNIGSNMFVDSISASRFSSFTNMNTSNGLRILSLLPRLEVPGTVYNMNDGVSASGQTSNGLDVSVSTYLIMGFSNQITVSSAIHYNHTSSISSFYTNPYSRELIFTNGYYTHPGGLDYSLFRGEPLGYSNAIYPNFNTDLSNDVNFGNRYATFLFNSYSNNTPVPYQFATIRVRNPSAVSTITNSRLYNYAFPDTITPDAYLQYQKVRMHMKLLGATNLGTYLEFETSWINCLKGVSYIGFDDNVFDTGGLVSVTTSGNDVLYKVQFERRFYTSLYPVIRVGISRDGSAENLPADDAYLPITFDGVTVTVSDI